MKKKNLTDIVLVRQEWMEVEEHTHNPDGYSLHKTIEDLKKYVNWTMNKDFNIVPFGRIAYIRPSKNNYKLFENRVREFGGQLFRYKHNEDEVLFYCSESIYSLMVKDAEVTK